MSASSATCRPQNVRRGRNAPDRLEKLRHGSRWMSRALDTQRDFRRNRNAFRGNERDPIFNRNVDIVFLVTGRLRAVQGRILRHSHPTGIVLRRRLQLVFAPRVSQSILRPSSAVTSRNLFHPIQRRPAAIQNPIPSERNSEKRSECLESGWSEQFIASVLSSYNIIQWNGRWATTKTPKSSCQDFDANSICRIAYGALSKLDVGDSIQFDIVAQRSDSTAFPDTTEQILFEYSADGELDWNLVQPECLHTWSNCLEICRSSRIDYRTLHINTSEAMADK